MQSSKEIKKEFKLKDLAEFYGLTPTTFSNYLRELAELEKSGFIPQTGRHNIVRALAFYYKFNYVGEEGNSLLSDLNSNVEFLADSILDLEKKEELKEEYYEALKRSIVETVKDLKNGLN
ncbi:MAG: hypothetical protein PHF52_08580 [Sulfurospirillaceae bacterium]|nr:hypothetical protein [Sulfurospirillaceae bacterium]